MRVRIEERERARAMRRQGATYGEIRRAIAVSKGTLNGWLKDIELTPAQKERILQLEIAQRGFALSKGPWHVRQKAQQRIRTLIKKGQQEIGNRISDPLFLTGLALYWAEGSKTQRCFRFTNSDPNAIRFMVNWLTKCVGIPKEKIIASVQVHRVYADCGFERYWEMVTTLPGAQFRSPYFKPTPHSVRKNPSYMGCCCLTVNSSDLFWKIQGWHQGFVRRLGVKLPEELDQTIWTTNRRSIDGG